MSDFFSFVWGWILKFKASHTNIYYIFIINGEKKTTSSQRQVLTLKEINTEGDPRCHEKYIRGICSIVYTVINGLHDSNVEERASRMNLAAAGPRCLRLKKTSAKWAGMTIWPHMGDHKLTIRTLQNLYGSRMDEHKTLFSTNLDFLFPLYGSPDCYSWAKVNSAHNFSKLCLRLTRMTY